MRKKNVISLLICFIVIGLYFLNYFYTGNKNNGATTAYNVYLQGEKIGVIANKDELYNLINKEQSDIKTKYSVDNVYPPNNFYLSEVKTYTESFNSVSSIYNIIALKDDFTIHGYKAIIRYSEEDEKEDVVINVLDKSIFEQAIKKFILAFISESDYNKYMNNEFGDINEVGQIIEDMKFVENITIKEAFISVNDRIFTNVDSLSQFLLFGDNAKMDTYTVKLGDSIESVSYDYDLNPQEFIIANPEYRGENVMLGIGDVVNVTLINPILTYTYSIYRIKENITPFSKKTIVDNTKPTNYSEPTQSGVSGISINKEVYDVVNGEASSEVRYVGKPEIIREAVDQITTIGPRYSGVTGSYIDVPGDWGRPTNTPYTITSKYKWRCLKGVCKLHEGIDISGTGLGSPIYAVGAGEVVQVVANKWPNGNYVVIKHDDDYYSGYLHLKGFNCKVGDIVSKGTIIGYMGESGYATGVHLHLGFYKGEPYVGKPYTPLDPLKTILSGVI